VECRIEQGEAAVLELRVVNEGNFPARGVALKIASTDENLRVMGKSVETLGTINPGSVGEVLKIPVSATRRIKPGLASLAVEITQHDFPTASIPYMVAIREEASEVIRASEAHETTAGKGYSRNDKGPEIEIKGAPTETEEEIVRLAIEVRDAARDIEDIKIIVNGISVQLAPESGFVPRPERLKRILAAVPLAEGKNQVQVTARNTDYRFSTQEIFVIRVAEPDVDKAPVTAMRNPDAVAVIVGVSKYEKLPPVNYARRDAEAIKSYLSKTLGYDERRIITLLDNDATLGRIQSSFRTRIKSMIAPGKSDIFVYYSGHGVPDVNSTEPYLAPYGLDTYDIANTGYPLKDLYQQLADSKARSVTTVIDACFSGSSENGTIIKDISPALLRIRNPIFGIQNGTLLTASSSTQVSNWLHSKKHGLFTYYFLLGLHGKADSDRNGSITIREIADYVRDNVRAQALKMNRTQTPEIIGETERIIVKIN